MKKNLAVQYVADPDPRYKFPIRGLNHLQESYREIVEQLCKSLILAPSTQTKLFGVVDTIAGSDHSISAGAIYWELSATAWSSVTAYTTGQGVSKSGNVYAALQASTNKDPLTEPTYWALVGATGEGQVFLVDAVAFTPLAGTLVAKFATTFITGDPATFTDQSQGNVHAVIKIAITDSVTGTGIFNFSTLNTHEWVAVLGGVGFLNSWADDTSSGNSAVRFKKDGRFLVLDGRTVGGLTTTVAFTLPAGYRPAALKQVPVLGIGGGGAFTLNKITIQTNGDVSIAFATNGNVTLDGVRVPLD